MVVGINSICVYFRNPTGGGASCSCQPEAESTIDDRETVHIDDFKSVLIVHGIFCMNPCFSGCIYCVPHLLCVVVMKRRPVRGPAATPAVASGRPRFQPDPCRTRTRGTRLKKVYCGARLCNTVQICRNMGRSSLWL